MAEGVVAGNLFDLGIALQSAKGAVVLDANVQYRLPVTGGGLSADKVINPIEETAQGRVRNTNYVAAVNVDGSPAFAARPAALGLLLYGYFGAKAVSGSADPWTHTFTLADTQPFFTVWKRVGPTASGGYYEKYRDCKIVSLAIASSAEGIVVVTPTIMGLKVAAGTAAATAVAILQDSVVFAHHHGEGAMLREAVAISSITDLALNLGADATRIRGNSLYGSDIAEQMRNIVLDTTQLVDWALAKRIMYGNATPADNDAPSAAVLELGSSPSIDFKYTIPGTPERSLQITASRVQPRMDPIDPNVDGAPLMATFHHDVLQPSGGASALTAILKNGVAAYAAAP